LEAGNGAMSIAQWKRRDVIPIKKLKQNFLSRLAVKMLRESEAKDFYNIAQNIGIMRYKEYNMDIL